MHQILIVCNSCLLKQSNDNLSDIVDLPQLFDNCDLVVFKSPLNVSHCWHHLYPGPLRLGFLEWNRCSTACRKRRLMKAN